MTSATRLCLLALLVAPVAASRLRTAPAAAAKPTAADVAKLRTKIETMANGLDNMLKVKDGTLGNAQVGPALKLFVKELWSTLDATKSDKDPADAWARLQKAKSGIGMLTASLTNAQVSLMKEDEEQGDSLLLGVLMTKQKQPMEAQLEILKSADFQKLTVSKVLLAKHDEKQPLYVQVAEYLDKHHHGMNSTNVAQKSNAKIEATAMSLQKRLDSLVKEADSKKKFHDRNMKKLEVAAKKGSKSDKHRIELGMKREDRKFKKWYGVRQHDISAMKAAITAVRNGDAKALQKARSALMDSLKAMQAKTGGFLHLLQLGHKVMQRDCPYCAAQCVDKCHAAGKSYVTCLSDCADAGK